MDLPLFGQQGQGRSPSLNSLRTINFYPVIDPSGKKVNALYGTPGLTLLTAAGIGPIRGSIISGDFIYLVSSNEVYLYIRENNTPYLIGTINTHSGPVSMTTNGLQVMIADGSGYVYDIATQSFGVISDPDFPGAEVVTYMDGFGLFTQVNAKTFFATGLLDFTSIDALDFASAEAYPDNNVSILSDHGEIWIFKKTNTEIWQDAGTPNFPFARLGNTRIERGCAATFSPAKIDNSIFWLGDDGVVYRAQGYTPMRISTEQIEYAVSKMDKADDAFSFTYDQEGHKFYVLTFPTANRTFVYDVMTSLWHERSSSGEEWRVSNVLTLKNEKIAFDKINGNIYLLDMDCYTENGAEILRQHVFPVITQDQKNLFFRRLEIDFEQGTGLISGQGSEPFVNLDWTDNGGRNFSNSVNLSVGDIGSYLSRSVINNLGDSRQRWFRITASDPIKWVILGIIGDVIQGTS